MKSTDKLEMIFSKRIVFLFFVISAALSPLFVSKFLLFRYLNVNFDSFIASFPNDLPDYWHEIASFQKFGFKTGYYTALEVPPPAGFTHFGVHGPIFIALFGGLARLTGWEYNTSIYFNAILLMCSILAFAFLAKIKKAESLALFLILVTFWPMHLLVLTTFQESLHQAGAIFLAGLFYRWWYCKEINEEKKWLWSLVLVLALLSSIRFSWALFYLPLFLVMLKRAQKRNVWLALPMSILLAAAFMRLYGYLSAPGHNMIFDAFNSVLEGFTQSISVLQQRLVENFENYFYGPPMDVFFRCEVFVLFALLLLICCAGKVPQIVNTLFWSRHLKDFWLESWFHAFNLGTIWLASMTMYTAPAFVRVFSISLILSIFILLVFRRWQYLFFLVFVHLAFVFEIQNSTIQLTPNFIRNSKAAEASFETFFNKYLQYKEQSQWCNTVLINWDQFDFRINFIPAGFGISTFPPNAPMQEKVKSRYALVTPSDLAAIRDKTNWKLVAYTPDDRLALLENLKSDCKFSQNY